MARPNSKYRINISHMEANLPAESREDPHHAIDRRVWEDVNKALADIDARLSAIEKAMADKEARGRAAVRNMRRG